MLILGEVLALYTASLKVVSVVHRTNLSISLV